MPHMLMSEYRAQLTVSQSLSCLAHQSLLKKDLKLEFKFVVAKGRNAPFLPKVDPHRAPGPINKGTRTPLNSNPGVQMIISPRTEASSPITVEVQQGTTSQVFTLPNNSLDPTKNYYVSLSIKPSASPVENTNTKITSNSSSSLGNHINLPPEDSGSLSAPPPAADSKGN